MGGTLRAALTAETFAVENPADGGTITQAPRCGAADVERAVLTAHNAFAAWSRIPARERGRAIARVADRIEAGFVQVNQYITPRPNLAYGGPKASGLGKEYSLESMLEHFTSSKTVIVKPGTPAPLQHAKHDEAGSM